MATSVVFPPIGGTTYSVPADGETNWAALSNYLIALASAQGTTSQKKAVRKCITTPVTVVSSSDAVINVQLTTPGAVSVVLPVSPQGQFYSVVDGTGDAATNNITITASGGATINGAASYLIVDNRASVDLIYITAANNWIAISNSSAVAKTLKQTYDTSVPARIALTSASGGLELRDAATPLAASLFKVADTTGGVSYINVTSAGITGSNLSGSNTGDQSLDTLTNVSITSKQISDIVSWNGIAWVNGPQSTATGTGGVIFYNATPILIAASANCAIAVGTLAPNPVVTGDVNITTALNANTVAVSAWLSVALGRTTISSGEWDFQSHLSVDSALGGRVTSITRNTYRASPNQAGTVTVTGAGTTRTVTASTGTPFAVANITASATNTNAAYLKTPQGIFQISARTSDTVVTITVLAGYANEAAVAFSYWEKLFSTSSSTITSITPVFQEINFNSLQSAFTCATTDAIGIITFGVSTGGAVTLTSVYNGTVNHAFVTTPLAIRHNDLPNLQGGSTNEYYHSTLAEYTGSGTGVFARVSGASIGLSAATGLPLTTGVTGVLPIANGGTGQITANAALNAFLPTQTANSGKVLTTDGTNSSWTAALTSILPSAQIFVGNGSNLAAAVAVSSEASLSNTGAMTLLNSAVIGKVLTGYVSGSGTVADTDTILQAINKLNGNDALKAPLASPTFTGVMANALGALGTPSYSFTGDTDTGMWSSAAGFVNFSTDGALGLTLSAGSSSPVLRVGKQTDTPFSNASSLTLATGTGNSGRLATFCYNNANPPLHISVGQGSGIPSIMWGALEQTAVNNTQIYALASTTTAKISTDASAARAFTLQVAPAGTINTQITWADAVVATSAGACTLGPVGGTYTASPVTIGSSTTTSGSYALITMSSTAASRNSIEWYSASTLKGRIGSDNPGNNLVTGSSAGDFCIVSNSQNILFSGDNGNNIHGKMTTAGAWKWGADSGTQTHTANGSLVVGSGGSTAIYGGNSAAASVSAAASITITSVGSKATGLLVVRDGTVGSTALIFISSNGTAAVVSNPDSMAISGTSGANQIWVSSNGTTTITITNQYGTARLICATLYGI